MYSFIKLPSKEQQQLLTLASEKFSLNEHVLEKDFWVCLTLNQLFQINSLSQHLTFKGGTSLSKVYNVIKRFSEDIDLSIEKGFFGYCNEKDPENHSSNKKRKTLIKELASDCSNYVKQDLLPTLNNQLQTVLPKNLVWNLLLDENDPDQQTILFEYPRLNRNPRSQYIKKEILIEIGARSEHWPVSTKKIIPYLAEVFPNEFVNANTSLKVLNIERTFWEKATILHSFSHYPAEKNIAERQSRHYYDLHCLLKSEYKEYCQNEISILKRVAQHKSIYFRAAWAQYEDAKPGSLKLIPKKETIEAMERDYNQMKEMFFSSPPEWSEIIQTIQEFENEFNSTNKIIIP